MRAMTGVSGSSSLKRMFGWPTSCRNTASRTTAFRSRFSMIGFGIRAKPENSSTMRRMSPTWRTIVSVHWSKTLRSSSLDPLAEAALQPLGGELDRRQRILDLVRDAARDVRPGRAALRRHQVGDVVEGDDEALDLALGALLRDLDVEGPHARRRAVSWIWARAGPRRRCRASVQHRRKRRESPRRAAGRPDRSPRGRARRAPSG